MSDRPTDDGADAARAEQFRRLYHELRITDQRGYYEARSHEYARAHDEARVLRTLVLLGASIAAAAGQFTTATGRAGWSLAAAVLAALAGLMTAYEALMGFSHLAKVYADAAASLAVAEIDWETAGSPAELADQVRWVEAAISRENGVWGQLVTASHPTAPDLRPATPDPPPG